MIRESFRGVGRWTFSLDRARLASDSSVYDKLSEPVVGSVELILYTYKSKKKKSRIK